MFSANRKMTPQHSKQSFNGFKKQLNENIKLKEKYNVKLTPINHMTFKIPRFSQKVEKGY